MQYRSDETRANPTFIAAEHALSSFWARTHEQPRYLLLGHQEYRALVRLPQGLYFTFSAEKPRQTFNGVPVLRVMEESFLEVV